MRGADLTALRKAIGYSQEQLMTELGVKSRQTISSWEHSERIPRTVELALIALREVPSCRRSGGKRVSKREARDYFSGRVR